MKYLTIILILLYSSVKCQELKKEDCIQRIKSQSFRLELLKNLEFKNKWLTNADISDKKYVIRFLNSLIHTVEESLNDSNKISGMDRTIINSLSYMEESIEFSCLTIILHSYMGESLDYGIYIIGNSKNENLCQYINSDNLKKKFICRPDKVSDFITYLRKNDLKSKEMYYDAFDANNYIVVYHFESNMSFGNIYFNTWEYSKFLENIGI